MPRSEKDFSNGYLEGANPHPPRWYHRNSPAPTNVPEAGESKEAYRARTNFDLPPEQEAYMRGSADMMESLEAYRKPGQLPKVPKEPKAPTQRQPRPKSPRTLMREHMSTVNRLSSLARKASGKRR